MYCDGKPPDNACLDAWLEGLIFIGVDPFFYFESHAHQPGAPALVYDWHIDKIEMETGPFIETKPKHFERDPENADGKRSPRPTHGANKALICSTVRV